MSFYHSSYNPQPQSRRFLLTETQDRFSVPIGEITHAYVNGVWAPFTVPMPGIAKLNTPTQAGDTVVITWDEEAH